ncbi:MAG: YbhB/YbcL family Raf kinase inhibitor-like protein [Acidimicrobiia bacterium]|nr:YbhB/YbcL family Raf kinase inhibitor-like protein [Acidimicrobiia bacterium]
MNGTSTTGYIARQRRRSLLLLLVTALMITLAACGSNGRALQEPKSGATAPARKNTGSTTPASSGSTNTTAGAVIRSTALTLTSASFGPNTPIPKQFTCDGVNTSPPLTISGVPAGTTELVLVVTNQNVANQTLWLLAGLAPMTVSIPQGGVPSGAIQIVNSSGTARWTGPCPTTGTSTYEFALYALTSPSGLTTSASFADVNAAIAKSASASVISGSYKR